MISYFYSVNQVDYLIVGQGLAGTILATEVQNRGLSYKIIDAGVQFGSSYVAAGVINPLVLKRLTKSWRAKDFVDYNPPFYKKLNSDLGVNVYFENDLFKLINSEDEKTFWSKRYHEEDVSYFIDQKLQSLKNTEKWKSPFSIGRVRHCSWVDLKTLLNEFRLTYHSNILEESFDYDLLEIKEDGIRYNETMAKRIVFCDGAKIMKNPFFSYIPMGLNKGELITIESKTLDLKEMHKKKVFVLPIKENVYKIGATFEWRWEYNGPTTKKREELVRDLNQLINVPYKIINHEAGVRPSVKDRRPLLGAHPHHQSIYLFNGMGSRGCLMAPLLSKELIDFIENDQELPKEVNINRFSDQLG